MISNRPLSRYNPFLPHRLAAVGFVNKKESRERISFPALPLFFWKKEKGAKENLIRFAGLLFQQVLKEAARSALKFLLGSFLFQRKEPLLEKRKAGKRKPSPLCGTPVSTGAERNCAERVAFSLAYLSLSQEPPLFFWKKEKGAKENLIRFAGFLFQQVLKGTARSALKFLLGSFLFQRKEPLLEKRKAGKRKPSPLRGTPVSAGAERRYAKRIAFSLAYLSLSQETPFSFRKKKRGQKKTCAASRGSCFSRC